MATTVSSPCLLLPSVQQNLSHSIKALHSEDDLWYVGSSHGWLIVLDAEAQPLLLNPSSGSRIKLPPFPSNLKPPVSNSYFVQLLRKSFISKAVLLYRRPSIHNYLVVIIYGTEKKMAFCHSTTKTWTQLSESSHGYCDIIFTYYKKPYAAALTNKRSIEGYRRKSPKIYALTNKGSIEGYEFRLKIRRSPKKIFDIQPACKIEEEEIRNFPRNKFSTQLYLVESKTRELFMVIRYIGDFVNSDGKAIEESDLMISQDSHPLVCPYRTKHLSVYKLDRLEADLKWQKMKSLDDRMLFLGANMSAMLSAQGFPGFQANSIYFTDDRWDEMDLDYLYDGHDLGVFNVADGSIKPLIQGDVEKIDPAPIWIFVKP